MDKHLKDKPALNVEVNGQHVCTAGICGDGVLTASFHCYQYFFKKYFSRKKKEENWCNLTILGLFDDLFYWWANLDSIIVPDSVITLKIINAESIDEPLEIKHKSKISGQSGFFSSDFFFFWRKFRKKKIIPRMAFIAELNGKFICDTSLPVPGLSDVTLRIHNLINADGIFADNISLYISWTDSSQSLPGEHFEWYYNENLQTGDEISLKVIENTATELPPEFKPEKSNAFLEFSKKNQMF